MLTETQIQLCNQALRMIGEENISVTSSSSKAYILCDSFFWPTVDEALLEHNWNEARTYQWIVQDIGTPLFDWSYSYTLPEDCLKILRIGLEGVSSEWESASGKIYTNLGYDPKEYVSGVYYEAGEYFFYDNQLYRVNTAHTSEDIPNELYISSCGSVRKILPIRYICRLTDTGSWSSMLRQVFLYRLALKLCVPLTNNPSAKSMLLQEYEALLLRKNKYVDASQGRRMVLYKSNWLESR